MYYKGITSHFKELKNITILPKLSKISKEPENAKNCDKSFEEDLFSENCDENSILNKKRERGNSFINNQGKSISTKTQNLIAQILNKKIKNIQPTKPPITANLSKNIQKFDSPKKSPKKNINSFKQTNFENFTISQKTLELIKQIKEERKNRFARKNLPKIIPKSDSIFSLRFKYEDLLKEDRELPLPLKYKALYNTFIELDNSINYIKTLPLIKPTFNNLIQSIETSFHHRFDMSMLKKILYLVPQLYILRWEKNEDDYELIVDIPRNHDSRLKNNFYDKEYLSEINFNELQKKFDPIVSPIKREDLESRKTVFKNALYKKINYYHQKFMIEKFNNNTFDPFSLKTWHHDFELNKVDDIPEFTIEEKPKIEGNNAFERCIIENDIKTELINKVKNQSNSEIPEDTNNPLLQYVSNRFINKLKGKEEVIKDTNKLYKEKMQKRWSKPKKDFVKEIVCQIQNIFICREKESLNYEEFINCLINSSSIINTNYSRQDLKEEVQKIAKDCPNWIKIVIHSIYGKMIVLENAKFKRDDILNKLNLIDN